MGLSVRALRQPSVIPGFGVTLGFTLTYLSLIVLIPIAALVLRSAQLGLPEFWRLATDLGRWARFAFRSPRR